MRNTTSFPLRGADLAFSAKTFAAAMLALLIALWIDLPRPYWAMATVYITSQPLAGATASKALYRVLGTLAGAAAAVAIVPAFVNSPELLSLVIALWTGICLYVSLLDRTPRSYLFMLAGYTLALIGFPAVADPAGIFDVAVARAQEITLGIVCATLVSTIVLPRSVAPAVAAKVEHWLDEARRLSRDVLLGGGGGVDDRAHRLRLAAEALEIDTLATHLAFDRGADHHAVEGLRSLRLHMQLLLPLLGSIHDRLAALDGHVDRELSDLLQRLAGWIVAGDDREPASRLRAVIDALRPSLEGRSSWDRIMIASLLIRLRELVDIAEDCRALNAAIAAGEDTAKVPLAFRSEQGIAPARHRDHALALWSAAGVVIAILVCCAFWIATGWADGASAPMMAAVACSFFASQDDPAPSIVRFAAWSLVAIVIDAVYLFAIIPAISDVELLIAALAPAFLLFGVLIARPQTMPIGMALGANGATLLALQSTYSADFQSYANSAIAFMVGMVAAVVLTRLVRSVRAEWIAQRLLRTSWETLATTAERRGHHDRAAFVGLMLDRLGLLAQRFAAIPEDDRRELDNLNQLRVGLNIIDLRRARHGLTAATLGAIDTMLDRLAAACRGRGLGTGMMPADLLAAIDVALLKTLDEPAAPAKEDALIGLVGIRTGLFPDAPAYHADATGLRSLVA
ncbi:putative efflux transporter permease; putative fusaric acid resistance pump [Bradyrhizobium sp. ORS 278]|uniref:FUSC family protein n=1 Tax=Bradyrhizobium sp. (strain ORS 278) TaxID=114615 RepID=UPI0001507F57|nr:FUSC family protein [Bradyrhizobium sp. ORS 278]CAL78399.1 putative efflux transporter permease; putative fusaric acid resistance pump [Bradyrhizobium sp. ORS 278]